MHFPNDVREDPPDQWVPTYKVQMPTPHGEIDKMVQVGDATQKECPISIMARVPHMEVLAREMIHSQVVHSSTGAQLYGSDSSQWDCRWYDCVKLFITEDRKVDDAIKAFARIMG